MFQELLPDHLVQKYAGNLTAPARKNDVQIDCLVSNLQCTLKKTRVQVAPVGPKQNESSWSKITLWKWTCNRISCLNDLLCILFFYPAVPIYEIHIFII